MIGGEKERGGVVGLTAAKGKQRERGRERGHVDLHERAGNVWTEATKREERIAPCVCYEKWQGVVRTEGRVRGYARSGGQASERGQHDAS